MYRARCLIAELLIDAGQALVSVGHAVLPSPRHGVESLSNAELDRRLP